MALILAVLCLQQEPLELVRARKDLFEKRMKAADLEKKKDKALQTARGRRYLADLSQPPNVGDGSEYKARIAELEKELGILDWRQAIAEAKAAEEPYARQLKSFDRAQAPLRDLIKQAVEAYKDIAADPSSGKRDAALASIRESLRQLESPKVVDAALVFDQVLTALDKGEPVEMVRKNMAEKIGSTELAGMVDAYLSEAQGLAEKVGPLAKLADNPAYQKLKGSVTAGLPILKFARLFGTNTPPGGLEDPLRVEALDKLVGLLSLMGDGSDLLDVVPGMGLAAEAYLSYFETMAGLAQEHARTINMAGAKGNLIRLHDWAKRDGFDAYVPYVAICKLFTTCVGPLRLHRVDYPARVIANGAKHDLRVHWTGEVRYPVRLIFAPTPNQVFRGGNWREEIRKLPEFSTTPYTGRDMIWIVSDVDVTPDYEIFLKDEDGKLSNSMPVLVTGTKP